MLFRASHHSGPLEVELTRRNIPFVKFGGLKFLDAAHVKDVLAVLRFAENPRDRVAGFRVLQLLPGVGPATAERDARRHGARRSIAAMALAGFPCRRSAPPTTGRASSPCYRRLRARAPAGRPSSSASRLWYEPHLERLHEDAAVRRADLVQLEQIAAGYRLARALPDRTDARSAGRDQRRGRRAALDEDYLILSTIHSAKGQEWKTVFVLNVVDGCIPSDLGTGTHGGDRGGAAAALCRDDAGEGRAAPRHAAALLRRTARRRAATATSTRRAPASSRTAHPRRFQRTSCGRRRPRPARRRATPQARVDLGARMRGMWR